MQVPTYPAFLARERASDTYPPLTPLPACGNGSASTGAASDAEPNPAAASDAELLLAFRATCADGARLLSDWAGSNPCAWQGVLCDGTGRVIQL